ncbi:hypothetical protein O7631_19535 [Micromonospora sp. WMMD967]|nr:hypothetical protein [Micromonospora sp. WMMD967]MDG4838711.1 hypothetical protein [Micromonospora sp. WMMD967]
MSVLDMAVRIISTIAEDLGEFFATAAREPGPKLDWFQKSGLVFGK